MSAGPREQTTEPARDKIARAIHDGEYASEPWKTFDTLHPDDQESYRLIADAVVEALGLTEERQTIPKVVGRVECTCGCGGNGNPELHSCGYTHGHFEFIPSVRWVSGWSVVGGEPSE